MGATPPPALFAVPPGIGLVDVDPPSGDVVDGGVLSRLYLDSRSPGVMVHPVDLDSALVSGVLVIL